jgi:phospholipid/cholesterol/gamma-HCH transport system substrate-binding protein
MLGVRRKPAVNAPAPREAPRAASLPISRLRSPRVVGLTALVLGLGLLAVVFNPPTAPWARPLHIRLEAGAFGELSGTAGVEIGGVKVGQVDGLDLSGNHAVLRLSIDPQYAHLLHRDASAAIRPHGLLGPKYVELSGGHTGTMREGDLIPISRVTVATDVDQVLNSLQPDVRDSLKTIFVELGNASDGRGQDMNTALGALGASAPAVTTDTTVLDNRKRDLADFIAYSEILNRDMQNAPIDANLRDTNQVLAGLVQVEGSIGGTIDHTASVTKQLNVAFAGNSQNLAATLALLPVTFTKLETVVASGQTIVNTVNPSLPALMTAVVETESAFSNKDADGHYVRVMLITDACSTPVGPNTTCASPLGGPRSAPQNSSQPGSPVSSQASPGLSDSDIASLLKTPTP